MLTQARLKELLHYDPDTGIFRWRVSTSNRVSIGATAGTPNSLSYLLIGIDGQRCRAHRLAWFYVHGAWPRFEIDHINGRPNDNRLSNLREATRSQNVQNTGKPQHNTSGLKGVSWDAANQRWRASIQHEKTSINLGRFHSAAAAHLAYLKAAKEMFDQFARAS